MNRNIINESQGLWESLNIIYELENEMPAIERLLENLIKDGEFETTFKHLGSNMNLDKSVSAEQLIFNDVLIFIVIQNTQKDYETTTPEKDWEQQLDIEVTTKDLKNVLGLASILEATSTEFEEVLMNVRMKMPFARNQTLHYCTLDFGRIWRFGEKNNYLFVKKPTEDLNVKANKFITNDLPTILTLNFIINEDHQSALHLQRRMLEIETQIQAHTQELPKLSLENDTIMLAIRKDHIEELDFDIAKINIDVKKLADEINLNLRKLSIAIGNVQIIHDEFLFDNLNTFKQYLNQLQNWMDVNENKINMISNEIKKYSNEITKLIEIAESGTKSKIKEPVQIEKPSTYTASYGANDRMPIQKMPYSQSKNEYASELKMKEQFNNKLMDSIPLEWGSSYILLESEPTRGPKIFHDLVTEQFMGLFITKEQRDQLIAKFDLNESSVFQINSEPGEHYLPPILSKISHLVNEFLSDNFHSIIYLDAVDYLINSNDFKRYIQFNKNINESIVLNDAIFIISVNETSLNNDQLESLLKNSIDITNSEVEVEDLL